MGMRNAMQAALAGAAVLLAPIPLAFADTKAGVDDWAHGDYAGAIREWQAGFARGDADAEFNLGEAYMLGCGVPRDLARAEALFGKAAAKGHLRAADNYGLLLFQRGEHARAMPYIKAAADRGDPRAQYLLGLALFNGDSMAKDWVRGYALVSLAQQRGLPQAQNALAQMDKYIPLEQRQRGVAMSGEIAAAAEANRARQVAAADLTLPGAAPGRAPNAVPPADEGTGPAIASGYRPAHDMADQAPLPIDPAMAAARPAAEPAAIPSGTPRATPRPIPHHRPAPASALAPAPASAPVTNTSPPAPAPHLAAGGAWRLQFGAFGVAGNADGLWNRVKVLPEVAGHPRLNVVSGRVTKLQAGGYSQEAAHAACRMLTGAGLTCVPVKD